MSYGALIQRPLGRSVLVGAAADEVDLEAAVVVQEHVGAVAVDRAVGEPAYGWRKRSARLPAGS